jgi:hypothetical protein
MLTVVLPATGSSKFTVMLRYVKLLLLRTEILNSSLRREKALPHVQPVVRERLINFALRWLIPSSFFGLLFISYQSNISRPLCYQHTRGIYL